MTEFFKKELLDFDNPDEVRIAIDIVGISLGGQDRRKDEHGHWRCPFGIGRSGLCDADAPDSDACGKNPVECWAKYSLELAPVEVSDVDGTDCDEPPEVDVGID